jgi:hypothetical protein
MLAATQMTHTSAAVIRAAKRNPVIRLVLVNHGPNHQSRLPQQTLEGAARR